MARRRMGMTDILEMLTAWVQGEGISSIARRLHYTRVTVRKYIEAAQRVGLARGVAPATEEAWGQVTQQVIATVAGRRAPGTVAQQVAQHHGYLEEHVGQVATSVLHQRLRDERGLTASWGVFYRYVAQHWPDRLRRAPRVTIRRDEPSAGEEAQVDFFYVGLWDVRRQLEWHWHTFRAGAVSPIGLRDWANEWCSRRIMGAHQHDANCGAIRFLHRSNRPPSLHGMCARAIRIAGGDHRDCRWRGDRAARLGWHPKGVP